MATLTSNQQYAAAIATHSLYTANQKRWQFLLDSYVGGEDFKNGNYLYKYQLETAPEYAIRVKNTPLDNQCKSLISLYISFLFREAPVRTWDQFESNPTLVAMLEDADQDGRNMNAFMKDCAIWSSVFGMAWVAVAKPASEAITLADEITDGIRPYLSVFTPLTVLDWGYGRNLNGSYTLKHIKIVEDVSGALTTMQHWSETEIITTVIDTVRKIVVSQVSVPNGIGHVPFIPVYSERSHVRGLGTSVINDIADQQLMIANELSEIYDSIRLDSHPSLCATAETNISGAAAGQVITLPENLDPALKPYVLQFQGGAIAAIYDSIQNRRDMISAMGNVGSVTATQTSTRSGIALEIEFQLLNARLSSIADNLELAEEHIWKEVCRYLGIEYSGTIDYPGDFALHNKSNELDELARMKSLSAHPAIQSEINKRIGDMLEIDMTEVDVETPIPVLDEAIANG